MYVNLFHASFVIFFSLAPFILFLNLSLGQHPGNRKRLFILYAKEHGFDHNDPEQWYTRSRESLLSVPVSPILCFLLAFFIKYVFFYFYF
jgi:hypothetical protein